MTERLTEKTIEMQEQHYQAYHNGKCLWGGLIDKLGMLEDILEKYGIKNIRQLDARLSGEDKSHKSAIIWHNKYNEIKNELNIWKRALTKAVLNLRLSQIGHISLIDKFKTVEDLENYFYQQAKKELTIRIEE